MIKIWKKGGEITDIPGKIKDITRPNIHQTEDIFSKAQSILLPFLIRTPTPLSAQGKQSSAAAPSPAADSTSATDRR